MFLAVSLVAALVGVGFAGAAALLPDTGIDGTIGAFLALLGALAATLALGGLVIAKLPVRARGLFTGLAALTAILTALAAWFLMQDALLVTMVVTFVALLAGVAVAKRKTIP